MSATDHAASTDSTAAAGSRPTITAYVIAYNEAEKIAAAVGSVLWADEVIVADSHSTDGTAELAESLGARVIQVDFDGFGRLRNTVLDACTGAWIFSLDADERCTPEARDEILRIVADPASADIYKVPRRNWFLGRWIRHSDWYPDFRQPQLFRNGAMRYDEKPVHEGWVPATDARVAVMKSDIWQFPFQNLEQWQHKIMRYSTLGVQELHESGRRGGMLKGVLHGAAAFVKHYFIKLGFLDGWAGFVIAFGSAENSCYKYMKAREKERDGWPPPQSERLD